MRLTQKTSWTAAGILLLGTGLVAALSALLVPAGADTLSALVVAIAAVLAVLVLAAGPGSLVRGVCGVLGAFALAALPLLAVLLEVAGIRVLPLVAVLQLGIVIGGALFAGDVTRARPARVFTVAVATVWAVALALVVAAPTWAHAAASLAPTGVMLAGSWVLSLASILLGVVLLGAVRLIAVSEQSAYPAASEVTDR